MNVVLSDAALYDSDGTYHYLPLMYIQARNIRNIHIPDNVSNRFNHNAIWVFCYILNIFFLYFKVSIIKAIKKQVAPETKTKEKKKRTFKESRAQKQQKETLKLIKEMKQEQKEGTPPTNKNWYQVIFHK